MLLTKVRARRRLFTLCGLRWPLLQALWPTILRLR
jgi:hypothetical protein